MTGYPPGTTGILKRLSWFRGDDELLHYRVVYDVVIDGQVLGIRTGRRRAARELRRERRRRRG